jgi:hypothetical protein
MIKNLPSFNYTELLDQLEIIDLKAYFSNGCDKIYMEEDLSCYEKRYCIYWYKYQKGAPATTDFMPDDWVKLDSLPENTNLEKNIGIPNADTNFPMNEKLC